MNETQRPLVGIGLMIVKDGAILLGKRKSTHGRGQFGAPGGHFEYMETLEDSIMREFREEVGNKMQIANLRYLCTTNMRRYAPKHYLDIGMVAEWVSGEPIVMEPDKLESWNWYKIDELPDEVFGCMDNYIEAYKTGRTYFTE